MYQTSPYSSSSYYSKRFQTRARWYKIKTFLLVITSISFLVLFSIDAASRDQIVQATSDLFGTSSSPSLNNKEGGEHEELEEGKFHGRYPNSLLTLFYPYTMFRDIVLDQPINMTDIPFFWHLHNSDEKIYKQILTKCYGLEIVELDTLQSIEKAIDVNLVSGLHRSRHVITSPFIRETAEIFTTDNFGRMICFFRHPLDYDLHPALPQFEKTDNWLTRYLSNIHEDDVTFTELAIAKQVVRQTCLVGTLDEMRASIIRFQEHFGWKYVDNISKEEGEKCIDDAMMGNVPDETWIDHEGEEFKTFYKTNLYDCQLYELARSARRHQVQTIVPWEIQLSREEDDDEDEGDE
jgi:hypothetical protein